MYATMCMYIYTCCMADPPFVITNPQTRGQDKAWIKGNIVSHFRRMYDAYFQDIKLLGPEEASRRFCNIRLCVYCMYMNCMYMCGVHLCMYIVWVSIAYEGRFCCGFALKRRLYGHASSHPFTPTHNTASTNTHTANTQQLMTSQ